MRGVPGLICGLPTVLLTLVATPRSADAQWSPGGDPVSTASRAQVAPLAVSDGSSGAIAAWADVRNGNWDVYAQRINIAGQPVWSVDGVPVCTARGSQQPLSVISDGAGGAIVAWYDHRCGGSVYAQRLDASGRALWTDDGVALSSSSAIQLSPKCVSDGTGGAIAVWVESGDGIHAQRVDAEGRVKWSPVGVAVADAPSPSIDTDGAGGAIIAFAPYGTGTEIVAQRIDSTGAILWGGGVMVRNSANYADQPAVVSDGLGGAVVVWADQRAGDAFHIWSQRIGPTGNAYWATNGVALCTAPNGQFNPVVTTDGAHGAIAVWTDYRNGPTPQLYARRITTNGDPLWGTNGVPVCVLPGSHIAQQLVPDGFGGALLAWQDSRGTSWDIYAQRLTGAGTARWVTGGIRLCAASGDQTTPTIVADNSGGSITAWTDARASAAAADIYEQRVDSTGAVAGNVGVEPAGSGAFRVQPAVPNPAHSGSTITFELPVSDEVTAAVYDASGRHVRNLATHRHFAAGVQHLSWDARDSRGAPVAAGIYFLTVRAGGEEGRCKLVVER